MAGGARLGASLVTTRQQTLRVGQPVWLRHAGRPKRQYPSLSSHHDTSVAIVVGGMTGALVAHVFASAGISTVLLENAFVGRGSTGASSTLLLQEPDRELTELVRRWGLRTGKSFEARPFICSS